MLKIYHVNDYVSVDGAKWRKVGTPGYRVADEELQNVTVLNNASFNDVRKYLTSHLLDGVWNDSTFFRHKPTVVVSYTNAWDPVSYRSFNTLSYKTEYKEWKNVTFEWMMQHLSAEQLIQYLKERGMTACPIVK